MFACAANDWAFPDSRIDQVEAYFKRNNKENFHKVVRYPRTYHGFAVRGDESDKHIQEQKHQFMLDALNFFNSVFAKKQ